MKKQCYLLIPLTFRGTAGTYGDTDRSHVNTNGIHRGSYMSAHVLLNLLNELGKRYKM